MEPEEHARMRTVSIIEYERGISISVRLCDTINSAYLLQTVYTATTQTVYTATTQTVYTANTTGLLQENCSNKMILANFIANRTILMF